MQIFSKLIRKSTEANNQYFSKFGKKLCDPHIGVKSYRSVLNKMIGKKELGNTPLLLKNGLLSLIHKRKLIFPMTTL